MVVTYGEGGRWWADNRQITFLNLKEKAGIQNLKRNEEELCHLFGSWRGFQFWYLISVEGRGFFSYLEMWRFGCNFTTIRDNTRIQGKNRQRKREFLFFFSVFLFSQLWKAAIFHDVTKTMRLFSSKKIRLYILREFLNLKFWYLAGCRYAGCSRCSCRL